MLSNFFKDVDFLKIIYLERWIFCDILPVFFKYIPGFFCELFKCFFWTYKRSGLFLKGLKVFFQVYKEQCRFFKEGIFFKYIFKTYIGCRFKKKIKSYYNFNTIFLKIFIQACGFFK